MKNGDLLRNTDHRPWQLPNKKWQFYQEWNDAIFLHWQVNIDDLKKFIPSPLEIDLFEGKPWVSLVAFSMENIKPRNLPSFPPLSNFSEINIRTYVKSGEKTGVYFLSIEGGKRLSCIIAKAVSELPYRFSKMKRTTNIYASENKTFGDKFELEYELGSELASKTELDTWLTERYALFQDANGRINQFDVHHIAWPMRKLAIKHLRACYPRFDSLINNFPDCVHYSKGVQVLAWGKQKNGKVFQRIDHKFML